MHANDNTPPPASAPSLLLDEREAARRLSISPRTLWSLRKRGEIAAVRIGVRVLYSVADLESFIAAHRSRVGAGRVAASE